MPDTAQNWSDRAERHSLFGFTDMPSVADRGTIVITRGEGVRVYDTEGRGYLDANSGLWNMVAGWGHPRLAEAARAQYDRLPGYHAFFGRMSDRTVELSERLIALSPFDRGRTFFTNSGSEANDTLVKMFWLLAGAEGRPEKRKILTRRSGYHGVTLGATSMTGKPYNGVFGLPLPGFLHLTCPHHWAEAHPGEDEDAFTARLGVELADTIAREGAETIAAFVAEPVIGAGGVIPPPRGYFQTIAPILAEAGIPLVADEVICGFGRTGAMWGCDNYDFVPDAIVASKALTAGYFPMGAVILGPDLSDRLAAAVDDMEEFPHGFTASGHPVGCAIALAAIEVILEEGLIDRVRAMTPRFEAGLAHLAGHPHIAEWRGRGLMGALEIVEDVAERRHFPPGIGERVANTALDLGLICRPIGPSVVLCPPFVMEDGDMDEMFEKLGLAFDRVLPSG